MAKIETEQRWAMGVYRPGEDSSKMVTVAWITTCSTCGVEVRFVKVDRITGPDQAMERPTRPRCEDCFRAAKSLAARARSTRAAAANAADPTK